MISRVLCVERVFLLWTFDCRLFSVDHASQRRKRLPR